MYNSHEIDFEIHGEEMQFVEIELDPMETVIAESGSLMMKDREIEMSTIFGDGSFKSQNDGLFGKILSAGKRMITGESLFMTAYTHAGRGKRKVSFASPYPGRIIPIDLLEYNESLICQKDAFLCAAKGVAVSIEFSKKLGRGLFGGEGFILQKLEGDGLAFIHAGGHVVKRDLEAGEVLHVDTGCLVAYTRTIDFDIEFIRGIRNQFFGGEGFFFARIEGPGSIWIQSLPFRRLASRVLQNASSSSGKGEGSVLGTLGNLMDGDGF